MNRVTYNVALEVASHEAVIRQTYKDSVGKNTWSVGMTSATGHNVDRYIGKPQSIQHCMNLYVWALEKYALSVNQVFDGYTLTEAQFAAALSFHWNTGAIKKASWVKKWKTGDFAGAREAFMRYNKPKEIIGRRKKERDLFFEGKWSNNGTMAEYTKLTSKMTPVWSSRKTINVSKELGKAFSGVHTPTKPVPVTSHKPAQAKDGAKGPIAAIMFLIIVVAIWFKDKVAELIGALL